MNGSVEVLPLLFEERHKGLRGCCSEIFTKGSIFQLPMYSWICKIDPAAHSFANVEVLP